MFLFVLIVKSDIEIFVWFVVKGRISISSVGATTGRPRSYGSPPHIRLSSFLIVGVGAFDDPRAYGLPPCIRLSSFLIVGVDVLDDPRSYGAQYALSFVTETIKIYQTCRNRRPRLSGYANGHRYATTCNLNHSRRCILYRYDIGQSRTPVPTIEKGYSIEILAFTVIFSGRRGRRPLPA